MRTPGEILVELAEKKHLRSMDPCLRQEIIERVNDLVAEVREEERSDVTG